MALSPEEEYWNYQRKRVKGMRNGLSRSSSFGHQGRAPRVPSYRRSAPMHLPRLSTPPSHRSYQSKTNLRKDSFDKIPEVKPRSSLYQGVNDDPNDSWGEEEDSDEEAEVVAPGNHAPMYPAMIPGQPYHYPLMMYPAPMFVPPAQPLYGAPGNQLYQMPPAQPIYPQHPINSDGHQKSKKRVRYVEQPEYLQGRTPVHFNSQVSSQDVGESPRLDYITKQDYDPFDPRQNPVLRLYGVSGSSPSNGKQKRHDLIREAAEHFLDQPKFAYDFVSDFIKNFVEEEMIPEILMEEFPKFLGEMSPEHPFYWPARDVAMSFLNEEIPGLVRDVVVTSTNELVSNYLQDQRNTDPVLHVYDKLMSEVVSQEVMRIVSESIQDMVSNYLDKASVYDAAMSLVDDVIQEMGPQLLNESIDEICLEDFIDQEILEPELKSGCQAIAVDTLQLYGDRRRQREKKEVARYAKGKLLDSFMTEQLTEVIGRQGKVWTKEEEAERVLDMTMLDVLMQQFFSVRTSQQQVIDNKPVRRFHERCFTDLALDVVLNELSKSLDEDMADLDEYELGLWNPDISEPPEWALFR